MMRFAILLLVMCIQFSVRADQGRIEYTTLLNSDSMHNMHSFSAYSPVHSSGSFQYYGGLDLVWYQLNADSDFIFSPRVLLGITTAYTVAPFIEFGTNLIDLVDLLDGEARDCSKDQCNPDADIKAGLKITLSSQFSVGIFYQGIHFGGFHDTLTGDHDIYGANIGLHF